MFKNFRKPLTITFIVAFLYSAENALLSYINSTFLAQNFNLHADQIGLLFSAGSILSIALLSLAPSYIYRLGKQKILIGLSLITALSILLVASIPLPVAGLMFIFFLAGNQVIWYFIDLEVEDETPTKETGRLRGILFTLINTAWLIFPALAAKLLGAEINPSLLYKWAGLTLVCVAFLTLFTPQHKVPKKILPSHISLIHILTFFKDTKRSTIFGIRLILDIFYTIMVIYTPLYLREVQLIPWSQIVGVFFIMLLPFVLLEFPVGYLEDKSKKFKESHFLIAGFIILFISLISIVYTFSTNWIVWASLLFVTRIGAALIEISTESYFFKHIHHSEIEYVSVFRSISPLSFIITPIFASMLLSFSGEMVVVFFIPIVLALLGIVKSLQLGRIS